MLMIVPQKADIIDVDTEKATKVPREWHDFEDAPASASGRACHLDVDDTFVSRKIDKKIESREQGEGMGARVRRSIGRPELQNFDPFLMLDEFKVGPGAGFPDHPHRGFETVTYMLPSTKGSFEHEDFVGHRGIIGPGDLQWMTAGKGILHSEIPASKEVSHGLQLWVNLAAKDKMIDPAYQELKAQHIPHVKSGGVKAIVIAGSALGITSPVYTRTPTHYIHFIMDKNSVLKQPIPKGWNAFLYILSGQCYVGGDTSNCITNAHYTITLQSGGDGVMVQTKDETCEFVLLAGKPHNEPIQQHGPFVMNTREQIMEAFRDYQSGRNGFERAIGWKSEIGKRMLGYHDDEL